MGLAGAGVADQAERVAAADPNDYSVDPRVIGRLVAVTATLGRVIVVCEGRTVADHERCWASRAVIADPAHVETARGLRAAYSAAKQASLPSLSCLPMTITG
ncbi:hypothetical protein [Agromyces sp. ISL-38]|uniref:Mu transposase domain-containing protein n=1 Tax=Agromyces sp. ISL-38 TaxID=2819107 RepID=UPI0035ABA41B